VLAATVFELIGPRQLVLRSTQLDDQTLQAGELSAETIASAISPGTETAAYVGAPPLRPGKVFPRVVGYCNVARVLSSRSSAYSPGDLILTNQSHCSHFIIPDTQVLSIVSPGVAPEKAALTYLYQLGFNALWKGGFFPGYSVAVIGLGVIGLAAVELAARFGGEVAAFSNQPEAKNQAINLGARESHSKSSSVFLESRSFFREDKFDLTILTTAAWSDLTLAAQVTRREGTIAVLGFPGRGQAIPSENPLDTQYFYDSQLRLAYCGFSPQTEAPLWESRFSTRRNCKYLLRLISEHRLNAAALFLGTMVRFDRLEDCYKELNARRSSTPPTFVLNWTAQT
jgi:threonine dehydrogenase-like Zn-dependent dehydrogenase